MRGEIRVLLLVAALLVGLHAYVRGLFPNASLSSKAQVSSDGGDGRFETLPRVPNARFGRLVLLLVDALRADFVFGEDSNMPRVHSLLKSGHALGLVGEARAPTVTMSRIKALTTGGTPEFLDVAMNLNSAALADDNWVSRAYHAGRRLVFYGDDTWLKLFPDHFVRHEGTTSFFVADTVEVDNNVTRHIDSELVMKDWDFLILHYLGLDHIGHSGGPKSPLMKPKQSEMDGIFSKIFDELERLDQGRDLPTLLLMCGDHGMTETGNHGGSTEAEVSTALVFAWHQPNADQPIFMKKDLASSIQSRKVFQVDVAPTIGSLLGLGIPNTSTGRLIPELWEGADDHELRDANIANLLQHRKVLGLTTAQPCDDRDDGDCVSEKLFQLNSLDINGTTELLSRTSRIIQSRASASYNLALMVAGMAIMTHGFVFWVLGISSGLQPALIPTILITTFCYQRAWQQVCMVLNHDSQSGQCEADVFIVIYSFVAALIVSSILAEVAWNSDHIIRRWKAWWHHSFMNANWSLLLVMFFILAYPATLFSSSFVEEEHQWWYACTSIVVLLMARERLVKLSSGSTLLISGLVLVLVRFVRSVNQTGIKHAEAADMRLFLLQEKNHTLLSVLHLLAVVGVAVLIVMDSILYFTDVNNRGRWTLSKICHISLCLLHLAIGAIYKANTSNDLRPAKHFLAQWIPMIDSVSIARWLLLLTACTALMTWITSHLHTDSQRVSGLNRKRLCASLLRGFHNAFLMLSLVLQRPHAALLVLSVPLLVRGVLLLKKTDSRKQKPQNSSMQPEQEDIMSHVLVFGVLSRFYFFVFGNSNSVATVDLTASTFGLTTYSPAASAIFTFGLTYCGPILVWLEVLLDAAQSSEQNEASTIISKPSAATTVIAEATEKVTHEGAQDRFESILQTTISYVAGMRLGSLLVFSLVVFLMRHHLFIWSVFSPKYLYEIMWTFGGVLFLLVLQAFLSLVSL